MTAASNNPPKEDMEQARKNVEYAMKHFGTSKTTVDRIMEMIGGAYRQGQQHKEGYCDFCGNKLPEPVCEGCGKPIHGMNYTIRVFEGKQLWLHDGVNEEGYFCRDLFREKKKRNKK